MKEFLRFSIASLFVLTPRFAFADDFSATLTDGSTITVLHGPECGGSSASDLL